MILERITGSPEVTNDGVTIPARLLRDQFETMGAQLVKEAAIKTNDTVGDGTTTAIVNAEAIVPQGMTAISRAGGNPGAGQARDRRRGRPPGRAPGAARPAGCAPRTTTATVAWWSAPRRPDDLGSAVARALYTVGDGGVVAVEDSAAVLGIDVDFVKEL